MARKRMLDPSIWDDEHVGMLSPNAFRLFICCISNADDDGKLLGSARYLRALAFRFSDDVSVEATAGWLDEIASKMRSFQRYTVAGREYIRFLKWHEYQVINKPTASKLPDPDELPAAPVRDDYGSATVALRDDSHLIEEKGSKEKGKEFPTGSDEPPIDPLRDEPPPLPTTERSLVGYYMRTLSDHYNLPAATERYRGQVAGAIKTLLRTDGLTTEQVCAAIEGYLTTTDPAWQASANNGKPPPGLIRFAREMYAGNGSQPPGVAA